MKNEEWRGVVGYEGRYQISSMGRVKSLARTCNTKGGSKRTVKERILKPCDNGRGYLYISLSDGTGEHKRHYIHRLVGEAFVPNPLENEDVNHKDENPSNNHASNLEWITHKENLNYGTRNERVAKANSKPVAQYTKDGAFIKAWASAAEVKRQLGFNHSSIIQVAKGNRKTAYGFIWRYV